MARVEGGAVIIDTDWPGIKNQIDTRNLNFKYEEDSTAYEIFAIDGQYFYKTVIYKSGQAPQNQATYDTWRAEFEADYKNRVTDFNSTQPYYLTTIDGYSVVLKDGQAPTANDGYGVAVIGYDGSNYRMMKSDTSGRPVMVGAGTAGTPTGGVITIQGHASGTPIPISGSITADNASVGTNDAAIPTSSTLIAGSDGTNLRSLRVFDIDTGGGQQWVLGVGLRKSAGGGSVEAGTASDPIRIDPTGTTTQPVSGTVTANQGGSWTVAATQSGTWTVQPGNTANTTPWLITINQGGNSATVTASNALKVDGSAVTQPVSGTVTANAGTGNFTVVQSTAANLRAQTASESATGSAIPAIASLSAGSDGTNLRSLFVDTSGRLIVIGGAANGAAVAGNPILIAGSDGTNARSIRTATDGTVRIDPTGTTTQPVSDAGASLTVDTTQLPAALVGGRLDSNIGAWLGSTAPTVSQKTMANSVPVVIASDQSIIPVTSTDTTKPTFYATFDRITMTASKYIATLFNTSSTRKVVVQRIWVFDWQLAAITGNEVDFGLYRISARTTGSSVTINAEDTNDSLSAGITADTNSTAVTQVHLIKRIMYNGEEINFDNGNVLNNQAFDIFALKYERRLGQRGITLRQNQGVSLQFISGDPDGSVSVIIEFTDEAA